MSRQAKLPVIFRKWKPRPEFDEAGGDIIALFPTALGNMSPYTCASYMTVGQHGAADPQGVMRDTVAATPSEYTDLLKELHGIGYRNLDIRQRLQYSYLKERERKLAEMENPAPRVITRRAKPKSRSRKSSSAGVSLGSMR